MTKCEKTNFQHQMFGNTRTVIECAKTSQRAWTVNTFFYITTLSKLIITVQ